MGEAIDSDDPRYLYLLCAHLLARDNMAAVVNAVTEHGTLMHRACLRGSLFAMQMLIWVCPRVFISSLCKLCFLVHGTLMHCGVFLA